MPPLTTATRSRFTSTRF